jgi:hypothetical protein
MCRSANGSDHNGRNILLYLFAALLLLSLGYAASRTLPLATPAFGEWAYHVVSSNEDIGPFLSAEASRKVALPSSLQQIDEHTDVDFGPLLKAFTEANISPETFWPTRTHEVSVSVGGRKTVIVYHCVVEWFSWRVHDISYAAPCLEQRASRSNRPPLCIG